MPYILIYHVLLPLLLEEGPYTYLFPLGLTLAVGRSLGLQLHLYSRIKVSILLCITLLLGLTFLKEEAKYKSIYYIVERDQRLQNINEIYSAFLLDNIYYSL